jgi:hypothetical protein
MPSLRPVTFFDLLPAAIFIRSYSELFDEQPEEGRACSEAGDGGDVIDRLASAPQKPGGIGKLLRAKVLERCFSEEPLERAGERSGRNVELLRELRRRGAGARAIAVVEVRIDAAPVPGAFVFEAEAVPIGLSGPPAA